MLVALYFTPVGQLVTGPEFWSFKACDLVFWLPSPALPPWEKKHLFGKSNILNSEGYFQVIAHLTIFLSCSILFLSLLRRHSKSVSRLIFSRNVFREKRALTVTQSWSTKKVAALKETLTPVHSHREHKTCSSQFNKNQGKPIFLLDNIFFFFKTRTIRDIVP